MLVKREVEDEFKCIINFLGNLEDVECVFNKDHKGQYLLDYCFQVLNLKEKDYFGIRFLSKKDQVKWLDPTCSIVKQIKGFDSIVFYFRVKFFPADPTILKEEIARYLVFSQLREALLLGKLQCSSNELPFLMALIVQAEIGDYNPKEHIDGYISLIHMVPNQTPELEKTVTEIHQRDLKGRKPGYAELSFLKRAAQLETYGLDLQHVKDQKGKPLLLGFNYVGIFAFHANRKVHSYEWNEVAKLTHERRMFIVHATLNEKKKVIVGFKCQSPPACRFIWRWAVEHRYFFSMNSSSEVPPITTDGGLFRTCKLRFTGKVEKELLEDMKGIEREESSIRRTSTTMPNISALAGRGSGSRPESNADDGSRLESRSLGGKRVNDDGDEGSISYSYDGGESNAQDISEATRNLTLASAMDSFDEEDLDTSKTSTLPTEFDMRPDITPTGDEYRTLSFETPAVRSSPSSSLFEKSYGEPYEDEPYVNNGEKFSPIYDKGSIRIAKGQSMSSCEIIRNIILSTLLLLLFFSLFVILIIESDSEIFSPIRKIPEMVVLRRDYYEPIKNSILSKTYQ